MPARNSVMLGDGSIVESWKNGSEPALVETTQRSARLFKDNIPTSESQEPLNTHTRNISLQNPDSSMSIYPLGRRAKDQLKDMEIADPSGLVQPHELEGNVPSELDAESPTRQAEPWTGRVLNSEANSPSRKASLRTRRATTKSGRDSGFFVPKPSSLGMRKLEGPEVNAELVSARGSSNGSRSTASSSHKVSPMTSRSLRGGFNPIRDSPLSTVISHESMELDAESPQRRASFSSWRRSTFDVAALPERSASIATGNSADSMAQNRSSEDTIRGASELSGDSMMNRASISAERDSFPPRATRSLEIPKRPYSRPVVVMNSPTESSAASEDEDNDNDNDTDDVEDPNALWAMPHLALYSSALSREQWISPLASPAAPFSTTSSSPTSSPSRPFHKVSPLPSPHLQDQQKQQSDMLAPDRARKDSNTIHYPSWSEISGFDFAGSASPEPEDGEDGWRPVQESAEGRYELAT